MADRAVKHYVVQPKVFQDMCSVLTQLPYNQVGALIQRIEDGSTAVFEHAGDMGGHKKTAKKKATKKKAKKASKLAKKKGRK